MKNDAGGVVSFCQTVLPGNEAMLIPTRVEDRADLAVPGPAYWASTAAQYVLPNHNLKAFYLANHYLFFLVIVTISTLQEPMSEMLVSGDPTRTP